MPTTQLPKTKEMAHEIAARIANSRPLVKDRTGQEDAVSGGFNQKSHPELVDRHQAERDREDDGTLDTAR